jgi:hypothetical protein
VPAPRASTGRGPTDLLRRMVLLLETAEGLELRARRIRDPRQVPVLLRLAEHRRRQAAQLREKLAATGAALAAPIRPGRSADTARLFRRTFPHGHGVR